MEGKQSKQELLDNYVVMAEYYEAERNRVRNDVAELNKKSAEYQRKIDELEAEVRRRGLLPPESEEQKAKLPDMTKTPSVALAEGSLITKLNMTTTGFTTFSYIADAKNPPVGKSDYVYIVGELTKGRLLEMRPVIKDGTTLYSAELAVEPGYKYTFCFKVGNILLIDSHYPTYLTKVGRYVNYVNVADPRKKLAAKMETFVDKSMHHIERKRLEDLYNNVINTGELPLLKELEKHVGRLYYAIESLNGIFKLVKVSIEQASVLIRRLTDQNFIPLSEGNIKQETKKYTDFMKEYVEIPEVEAEERLQELAKKRLTVLYQSFGPQEYSLIGARPEVPLSDYAVDFDYTAGRVDGVRNTLFGEIDWGAEPVDNEYAFLTVDPIEIYGQELDVDVYNLIHVHIASLGESATVDVRYLKKFEETEKYYKFEKDIVGAALKYRLLIQNGSVKTMLYSYRGRIKELECVERKYKVGDMVGVKTLGIPDTSFARIVGIPVQTLAALDQDKIKPLERGLPQYETISVCGKRHFEELLGYIDVELLPDLPEKPAKLRRVSVPICMCKRGVEEHKQANALIQKWKDQVTSKCAGIVTGIKQELSEIVTKGTEMKVEEKKARLEHLQTLDGELAVISEDELNGFDLGVIKETLKESSVAQRKLAYDIRLAKFA